MRRDVVPGLILLIIFIPLISLYLMGKENKRKILIEEMNNEFPLVGFDEQLNSVIASLYYGDSDIFRTNENFVYLKLNNSVFRRIFVI